MDAAILVRRCAWPCALAMLVACSDRQELVAPPRADDPVPSPHAASVITVPVEIDRSLVARAVEQAMPRRLWSIDKPDARCMPPRHVKLLGRKLKVIPAITCRIVGEVTRGPIRLHGEGKELIADVPIRAQVSAQDIAGLLKGETATGQAMAHARLRLTLAPDWTPRGTLRLDYDWTRPPGIDFLGQRITFADKVDQKLAPVLRQLEQRLPRELAKVALRPQVERLWRHSFTALSLNDRDPPVWMRVTPQRFLFDGYAMEGRHLRLKLGIEALTETMVGEKPGDPAATPLPPPATAPIDGTLRFFIPVRADYAQLEPVILRALRKRALRPFAIPKLGPVTARFDKVTAYGTNGGRIAVGVALAARPTSGRLGDTNGIIWLTARPVNAPNSAVVRFEALTVTGDSDRVGGDILLALAGSPEFAPAIADALSQNFTHDLDGLTDKIRRAIKERRTPHLRIAASLDRAEIGQISAHGQGLYLPVRATGHVQVRYDPATP